MIAKNNVVEDGIQVADLKKIWIYSNFADRVP
jgi:hypothetical protein